MILTRDKGKEILKVDMERMENALEKGPLCSERVKKQIEELKIRDGDMIFAPKSYFYVE